MRYPEAAIGEQIYEDISRELERQRKLQREGKFQHTCETQPNWGISLAILMEEVGEVAHEINEDYDRWLNPSQRKAFETRLRKELIQVAAVAIAWINNIDAQKVE